MPNIAQFNDSGVFEEQVKQSSGKKKKIKRKKWPIEMFPNTLNSCSVLSNERRVRRTGPRLSI